MIVIPAEAGIQKNLHWMPHQVRHDMPTKSEEVLDALRYGQGAKPLPAVGRLGAFMKIEVSS